MNKTILIVLAALAIVAWGVGLGINRRERMALAAFQERRTAIEAALREAKEATQAEGERRIAAEGGKALVGASTSSSGGEGGHWFMKGRQMTWSVGITVPVSATATAAARAPVVDRARVHLSCTQPATLFPEPPTVEIEAVPGPDSAFFLERLRAALDAKQVPYSVK